MLSTCHVTKKKRIALLYLKLMYKEQLNRKRGEKGFSCVYSIFAFFDASYHYTDIV